MYCYIGKNTLNTIPQPLLLIHAFPQKSSCTLIKIFAMISYTLLVIEASQTKNKKKK